MREEFLKKLIKAFPNYMELGAAVHKYHTLIHDGMSTNQVEEYILHKTFKVL